MALGKKKRSAETGKKSDAPESRKKSKGGEAVKRLTKEQKFINLLSEKIHTQCREDRYQNSICGDKDALLERLDTAVASLPNSQLKASLQKNLKKYTSELWKSLSDARTVYINSNQEQHSALTEEKYLDWERASLADNVRLQSLVSVPFVSSSAVWRQTCLQLELNSELPGELTPSQGESYFDLLDRCLTMWASFGKSALPFWLEKLEEIAERLFSAVTEAGFSHLEERFDRSIRRVLAIIQHERPVGALYSSRELPEYRFASLDKMHDAVEVADINGIDIASARLAASALSLSLLRTAVAASEVEKKIEDLVLEWISLTKFCFPANSGGMTSFFLELCARLPDFLPTRPAFAKQFPTLLTLITQHGVCKLAKPQTDNPQHFIMYTKLLRDATNLAKRFSLTNAQRDIYLIAQAIPPIAFSRWLNLSYDGARQTVFGIPKAKAKQLLPKDEFDHGWMLRIIQCDNPTNEEMETVFNAWLEAFKTESDDRTNGEDAPQQDLAFFIDVTGKRSE